MSKGEALVAVLLTAVVLVVGALALEYFNVDGWQNLAGIGGVLFFAFFAILIGAITRTLLPSITGSAAITAFIMAYVYPGFAIFMSVIFAFSLGLAIYAAYSGSRTSYGY